MTDPASHLARALQLAQSHSRDGTHGPFGAVVVQGDRVVGEGFNCVTADCDPTAHAEINAIRAAARTLGRHQLGDCVLYASCEPCPMCLAAICWAHIPVVYYAAGRADAQAAGFDDQRIHAYLCGQAGAGGPQCVQLAHPQAGTALQQWLQNPVRRAY